MLKAQKRRTQNKTKIEDYIDCDHLCIEIRKRGGAAYVETQENKNVLYDEK